MTTTMGLIILDRDERENMRSEMRTHMREQYRGGYRHHESSEVEEAYKKGYKHGWEDKEKELKEQQGGFREEDFRRGRSGGY